MLSPDGNVAQQGSYDALSKDNNGAFMKLMEWQMSGGDTDGPGGRVQERRDERHMDDHSDILNAMAEPEEEDSEDQDDVKIEDGDPASETVERSDDGTKAR